MYKYIWSYVNINSFFRDYAMNPTNSHKLNSVFLCKNNNKQKKILCLFGHTVVVNLHEPASETFQKTCSDQKNLYLLGTLVY